MRINLPFDFEQLLDLNNLLQIHATTEDLLKSKSEANEVEYATRLMRARQILGLPMKGRHLFEKPLFSPIVTASADSSPWIRTKDKPPTKEYENDGKVLFIRDGHLELGSATNAMDSEMWMVCPPSRLTLAF